MSMSIEEHQWREYNEHGNTCHYPGCDRSEEEHASVVVTRNGKVTMVGEGTDLAEVLTVAGVPGAE